MLKTDEILFNHRLGINGGTLDAHAVANSVSVMTSKATGLMVMISCYFDAVENGGDRLSNDSLQAVLMTVEHEINDMNALVQAWHKHQRQNNKQTN